MLQDAVARVGVDYDTEVRELEDCVREVIGARRAEYRREVDA